MLFPLGCNATPPPECHTEFVVIYLSQATVSCSVTHWVMDAVCKKITTLGMACPATQRTLVILFRPHKCHDACKEGS